MKHYIIRITIGPKSNSADDKAYMVGLYVRIPSLERSLPCITLQGMQTIASDYRRRRITAVPTVQTRLKIESGHLTLNQLKAGLKKRLSRWFSVKSITIRRKE